MHLLQFSRTVAPETSKGPVLLELMTRYNWTKAVILTSNDDVWLNSGLKLTQQLQAASMTVYRPSAFEPSQLRAATLYDIRHSGIQIIFDDIRHSGIRIIFVFGSAPDVKAVFIRAQRHAMTTAGWAWIELTFQTPSTFDGLNEKQGGLYLQPLSVPEKMRPFAQQVSDYSKTHFNINVRPESVHCATSAALHDAIMLYAHAATRVMLEGGDLCDGKAVTAAVRNTTFEGVGHHGVVLDRDTGDRIESYVVMNYVQDANGGMSSVAVGVYDAKAGQYVTYERAVVWPGADISLCNGPVE